MPIECTFHFVLEAPDAIVRRAEPAGFRDETFDNLEHLYGSTPGTNITGQSMVIEARFVSVGSPEVYTCLYAVGDLGSCVAVALEDGRTLPLWDLDRDMALVSSF